MRRAGNLIDRIADLDNLYLAFLKARRGKQAKPEVVEFCRNFDDNIEKIRNGILGGDVSIGKYKTFEVYDPKKRTICAAAFDERVLHHAIVNVCGEYFDRHLIYDTYATRQGKGQYAAIARAREAFRKFRYVLKLDFRKYFDSIPHDVLFCKLQRLFKDKTLLSVFSRIISSYSSTPGCGVPIGNLTSQYFANYYLSDMDHYAKEHLKIKYYVRYMDDILIFSDSKTELKTIFGRLLALATDLRLDFKEPVYCNCVRGVSFLGYKIFRHKILLNHRSARRFFRKLILYRRMYLDGSFTQKEYLRHLVPIFAFVRHAYSKRFRRKELLRSENR